MMTALVIFTRYRCGDRRISEPQPMQVNDFADAVRVATVAVGAMKSADPESDFQIVSIAFEGYRGTPCRGARMWETAEELSARVGAKES